MSVSKTVINKLGEDKDLYDTSSYSSDSAFFADNPVNVKSENQRIMEAREASRQYRDEYDKARVKAIQETANLKRVHKEEPKPKIEGLVYTKVKVNRKGFEKAGIGEAIESKPSGWSVNRIIQKAGVSSGKISQKLRKDRIAKKEARVKMYEGRMRRLARDERGQMRAQRRLSSILNKKHKENLMSSTEYRRMYGSPNLENDGNIMHAQDMFFSSDNRDRSNRDGGNILQAPDLILKGSNRKPTFKQKWI